VKTLKGFLLPVLLLLLWELSMRWSGIESDSLASPTQIAAAFWTALWDGTIARRTGETLRAALTGLAIGGGSALVLSIALGLIPPFARLMQFSIEVLRPIPSVALIPVAILVLGFGYAMEFSLVAFATFWPVLIYGHAAITNIDSQLIDLSKVLRLSTFQRITKVILPATLPRYFVAFRLAAAVSLIVSVTVEIAANPLGIGHELMTAAQSLHPDLMFAMVLWIGLIGWALNGTLLFAQRRLFGPAAMGITIGAQQ
jgi:ABC-type nitrate/sulfonate/bicarbonate transport system permease component